MGEEQEWERSGGVGSWVRGTGFERSGHRGIFLVGSHSMKGALPKRSINITSLVYQVER